ncbi:MAG TPA: Pycsar system effector family protein [Chloroflexota bacterium]|nr:Pycsar system effector family protein [Chloroflexota bacterium]
MEATRPVDHSGQHSPDTAKQAEFLRHVHTYVLDQIKMADTKAALIAGAAGLLFPFAANRAKEGPWLALTGSGSEQLLSTLRLVLLGVTFLAVVATLLCVFFVLRPRLASTGTSLVAFPDLVRYGRENYVKLVKTATDEDLIVTLAQHATEMAEIAQEKNHWINKAMRPLFIAALAVFVLSITG